MNHILDSVKKFVKDNQPEILSGVAAVGVGATAYFTAKGTAKAVRMIDEIEAGTEPGDRLKRAKERTRLVWKCYIPAAACGVVTVGCIVGSNKVSANRTAAASAAFTLSERAFSEYKAKVVEQVGENAERKIRDEIQQDRVNENPPVDGQVIVTGAGEQLCLDSYSGRYFKSDMETLRRAMNDINHKINNEFDVRLDEFYWIVGLPSTSNSGHVGWDSARQMELQFSAAMTQEGVPCIAYDFNYIKTFL